MTEYKSMVNVLRTFGAAVVNVSNALEALVPILDAIDRAEIRRKQVKILILKSYTLGLSFNEVQRLKKMQ